MRKEVRRGRKGGKKKVEEAREGGVGSECSQCCCLVVVSHASVTCVCPALVCAEKLITRG